MVLEKATKGDLSTMVVKFIATAFCARKGVWLRRILEKLETWSCSRYSPLSVVK